ncbi:MAG: HAD-IIIA family hydrolase [Candidatus Eisenbacteria bacterium]|nr:HAD-IIIA family hydrolase [Candidatus Latescibacterota bacterium]MBD3301850.1 HAD-IIIA family hydrolase [Candidatus Eisenbacteria bacterium]
MAAGGADAPLLGPGLGPGAALAVLRWIIFDVGNVLMNDDPTMALLYRELHRAMCSAGYRIPFRQLLEEREALIRSRGPEHWQVLGRKYLGEEGHWRLMHRCARKIRADYMGCHELLPGVLEAVRSLSRRYRIAVVANQLREVIDALQSVGLGPHISLHAISEVVGLRKPDPDLYLWALERADCAPGEAVMIGDRVDNDIRPARTVGMWTILYQLPHEKKGYTPKGEMEQLYFESQLRESICRIGPRSPEETPDETAGDLEGLLAAIERIDRRAAGASESAPHGR